MVQVRFWLKFHVDYGQTIRIVGGHEATGVSTSAACQLARVGRRCVPGVWDASNEVLRDCPIITVGIRRGRQQVLVYYARAHPPCW